MGLLDRIFRDLYESKAGRIHASPGGWAFDPPAWLVKKTLARCPNMHIDHKPHVRQDADGKDMTFVYQRTVHCPNAELCRGQYPRHVLRQDDPSSERWYYPEALCRKCRFHEKADRKYRFPRCLFRASENPALDAIKGTFGALQEAVNETNEIMR